VCVNALYSEIHTLLIVHVCVCARVSSSSYLEHTILIGLVLLLIRYCYRSTKLYQKMSQGCYHGIVVGVQCKCEKQ